MSNKTLSPSQQATGFTRGLTNKLSDMTEHGLLKSPVFQTALTSEIDAFVKELVPGLRDQYARLLERSFQVYVGRYIVPVNYDLPNVIATAIDANNFGYKYVYPNVADIPLGGTGEALEQVREVGFGKVIYNRDLPEALKKKGQEDGFVNGYVFANPLTALLWALKNPDVQKDHPLGILFYIGGRLYYLILGSGGGERGLDVHWDLPGGGWREGVRFLAVPAPPPVPA